jgi:hypothetical protein
MSAVLLRARQMARAFLLVAALAMVAGGTATPASAARNCGTLSYERDEGWYAASARIAYTSGVSCRRARKVVRACLRSKDVTGWRVISPKLNGRVAFKLIRGRRTIAITHIAGSTPYCAQQAFENLRRETTRSY